MRCSKQATGVGENEMMEVKRPVPEGVLGPKLGYFHHLKGWTKDIFSWLDAPIYMSLIVLSFLLCIYDLTGCLTYVINAWLGLQAIFSMLSSKTSSIMTGALENLEVT